MVVLGIKLMAKIWWEIVKIFHDFRLLSFSVKIFYDFRLLSFSVTAIKTSV